MSKYGYFIPPGVTQTVTATVGTATVRVCYYKPLSYDEFHAATRLAEHRATQLDQTPPKTPTALVTPAWIDEDIDEDAA